jgi:ABC-2 type transport system permease protein
MATAWAFLRRDVSLALSYRLSFLLQFLGIFLTVAAFHFLSKLVGSSVTSYLESYGGDYFSFVLLGLALSSYMVLGLQSFAERIREGQMMGTLEIMLLSPTRLSSILVASSLWDYAFGSLRVFVIVLLGSVVFGASFSQADPLATVVVVILSVASFAVIGMLSAAFVIILKKGDPITWAMGGLSTLLSGVFYPVAVLPDWLQRVSALLPLTYALNAVRHTVLQGYSLYEVRFDVLALLAFLAVLSPLALLAFRLAVRRAKTVGSLAQY